MDLDKFLTDLQELSGEIERQMARLEAEGQSGFRPVQGILEKLTGILPEWFFLIDQTGIGTKEQILRVLSDMEEAMRAQDQILLEDALLYGLQATAEEYIEIIKEAADEK